MENPSKQSINNLPKDIIFDIFSRIPLVLLYRIRCVCKKWQFLLELDPEFRGFYHQKHQTSPILLFSQPTTDNNISTPLSPYFIDGTQLNPFPIKLSRPLTSILSCNGVLCLVSNSEVCVYDPIILRASILHNSPYFSSTYRWSFGFSPSGNIFKVLHFYFSEKFDNFHYCQVKELQCEVISIPSSHLGMNSQQNWKFLGKCPFQILGRKGYAYVDGKLYWLIVERSFNPDCIKIMCLDLETDVFGTVCFPRTYSNRSVECLDLVEIQDKLCLTDRLPWESTMSVWMMMNENEGFANHWVKKYEIDLMGIVHHDMRILGHLSSNYDYDSEGDILIKVGEQSFGLYELQSRVFKEMGDGMSIQAWNLQLLLDRKHRL